MQPELHLGPLTIQTFGICFAVGFLAAAGVIGRRFRELGESSDWSWELTFSVMVGGLVGSRLDYLIENWDKVKDDLLGNLFSGSGLIWYGGVIGGALGAVIWAWRRGWLGWKLADVACIPLALGYAIGRCGCQLSGDGDYGIHSTLPWAMAYPKGTVPTTVEVHPTPVYETLAMGIVALVLWNFRDRLTGGRLFALYLVLAGIERLLVEFIRRNHAVLAGLTFAQLLSIVMIAFGLVLAARVSRTHPLPA
ncbi:MAG: phosphatidylglycerol---prolipoprotein diacylglyceryl transferase [Thermoleophilaceae bacterium]|jgi:phosphatidylglycerol:prolipoprotein diacylglycerol transferase|nr:phosphatidylglycerol---prolipoprotein diacylglyceryl transferase [Thermoleophilaceae bacterium]